MQPPAKRGKRPWHDIGVSQGLDQESLREQGLARDLEAWNARVEEALCSLYALLLEQQGDDDDDGDEARALPVLLDPASMPMKAWWEAWLWDSDPTQPCTATAPLNLCQLHGALIARALVVTHPSAMQSEAGLRAIIGLQDKDPRTALCHSEEPVSLFNVRDLKDCLFNLREHWAACSAWQIPRMRECLMMLLARLGVLASTVVPNSSLCDDEYLQPSKGRGACELTRAGLRRLLNVLLALFRSLQIHREAVLWEQALGSPAQIIYKHHIFASSDDFGLYSMHWDLPAATVLNYRHDFPGMYNHVSQVVYFHNPQYCKRVFKAPEPEDLLQGRAHPLYPFAGLLQLYPDIPVVFSDGALNIFSQGRHSQQWLLMDQQIFLVTREGRIYRHGARSSPLDLCPLISRENT